jgi:hypothetical protein
MLKKYNKITTLMGERTVLKERVSRVTRERGELILNDKNLKALIDFVAKLPGMLDKAACPEFVKKGFFAGGVIDSLSHSVPDFHCNHEMDNLKCVVPYILKHLHDNGHVPDEVYEAHGLPSDAPG